MIMLTYLGQDPEVIKNRIRIRSKIVRITNTGYRNNMVKLP
jgi:hypothetical protein